MGTKKSNLSKMKCDESVELTDYCPMPFGVYEGREMIKVPPAYLLELKKKYDERKVKIYSKVERQVYDYIIEMEEALRLEIKLKNKSKEPGFVFSPDINYINDREDD